MVSAMSETNKPVGVIGLGLMGMACVKRLRGAGISLLGFDIDGKKSPGAGGIGRHSGDRKSTRLNSSH